MNFTGGSVILGDLNDFLAPSQACVNPLFADAVNKAKPNAAKGIDRAGAAEEQSADGTAKAGRAKVSLSLASDLYESTAVALSARAVPSAPAAPQAKPDLIRSGADRTAKVSLNDCLACAGCVTSTETVLITQQSTDEMLRALADRGAASGARLYAASFSPQALCSLAAHFGVQSPLVAYRRLAAVFKKRLGFDIVVDTTVAAEISLHRACLEFCARYKQRQTEKDLMLQRQPPQKRARAPITLGFDSAASSSSTGAVATAAGEAPVAPPVVWVADAPTIPYSAAARQLVSVYTGTGTAVATEASAPVPIPPRNPVTFANTGPTALGAPSGSDHAASSSAASAGVPAAPLPVLASACPGWVCYAEKMVPEALPYVSTVKSPQQITGTLLKHLLPLLSGRGAGGLLHTAAPAAATSAAGSSDGHLLRPSDIFHVSVMPCFDKKLEGSRKDFYWETGAEAEAEAGGTKEVDCVVTSGEVADLLASLGVDLASEDTESAGSEASFCGAYDLRDATEAGFDGDVEMEADDSVKLSAVNAVTRVERLLRGVSADGSTLFRIATAPGGGNSDGYAETIFRYAARTLFGLHVATEDIAYVPGKNPDFRELVLTRPLGTDLAASAAPSLDIESIGGNQSARNRAAEEPLLRFALAYGFRNIQAVIMRMKRSARGKAGSALSAISASTSAAAKPYDYVEVMACPSGCINGGGQIKPASYTSESNAADSVAPNPLRQKAEALKSRVAAVEGLMDARRALQSLPGESRACRAVYALLESVTAPTPLGSGCRSDGFASDLLLLLHTQYHHVPKLESAAIKW
jgi:iron only hydrogenase large subunit-like protein